jgi:release factor glutamine methyltransferase
MRKLVKRLSSLFLIPLTRWYLRKQRTFRYQQATVEVFPGVFHPGLFHSTKFLLEYLRDKQIMESSLLELGCGTGLISVVCAMKGAHVTALDLSDLAVANTKFNVISNKVDVEVLKSDLFSDLPSQKFDWIIINPPYYSVEAVNDMELAWNAGPRLEYFSRLFKDLGNYIDEENSKVIMVLTKGADLDAIFAIALQQDFYFHVKTEKSVLFDVKDFIFEITKGDVRKG